MFEISEDVKEYCRGGYRLKKALHRQISDLMLAERLGQRRTVDELSKFTAVPAKLIDKQELHRKKINWCIIAVLLKFYRKKLVVSLEKDVGESKVDLGR